MTIVTARSGYDPRYYLNRHEGEATPAGYYLSPAQHGEAPGRWFGRGAEELGFRDGQQVAEEPYLAVYRQVDPKTGEYYGRKPGGYKRFEEIYQAKLAAEPHATADRKLELEREAAKETRRSPQYTDATVNHNKSVSILRVSMLESARRASLAGNAQEEALWLTREKRVQEIEQEANHAGLTHLQEHAGFVRVASGPVRRVGAKEPVRYEPAGLTVSTWLQSTNRDGEPHDHSHNVIARMAHTDADGEWRAVDTMSVRAQLGAMAGIVEARVRSALTREFGVQWEAREDGLGYEIKGITQEIRDAYSKRTAEVTAETAKLAKRWEAKYGRIPNTREMLFIANAATLTSRNAKEDMEVDWYAKAKEWDETYGHQLASLTEVCDFRAKPDGVLPDQEARQRTIMMALEKVQAAHSTWTRSDLIRALAQVSGTEFDQMTPDDRHADLFRMADEATRAANGVVSLEAPEWPPTPQQLTRDLDGRSIYTRPGTERFATHGQLALEERLVQQSQRRNAPHMDREDAARALGATAEELEQILCMRAEDAHTRTTHTGLRMDQAAMIFEGLTSSRRVSVGVGPAGSGKTYTLAAGAKAWKNAGRHVIGLTTSQQASNVLAGAGVADAWNSERFLRAVGRGKKAIPLGTLIIVDEASMMSMKHLAQIVDLAEDHRCKVLVTGDHAQLTAVESGGGMRLMADRLGYSQLADPVRFTESWERDASLRLRHGDETALDDYAEHGRITGAQRAELFDQARKTYVAGRLAGDDQLLMAMRREDCRELSRQIRNDLMHLGIVDGGASVEISHGQRASVGDLIVARENRPKLITDRAGGARHELTNGDIFRVEEVTGNSVTARRVTEPGTGDVAGSTVRLSASYLGSNTDLAYAITAHNGQGGTVDKGIAVVTGGESREWLYVAMTRGRERNTALVQTLPREADPDPKTRSDPELARHERTEAERAGEPAAGEADHDWDREPIAVLADCLEREEAEESATEYQRRELADADHLAILGARWDDLTMRASRDRYAKIIDEELPDNWKGAPLGHAKTWVFRSLRLAESAGVDPREIVRAAISSRSLAGVEDLSKVLYRRMEPLVSPLVPAPVGRLADRVPEVEDPEIQAYLQALAGAQDARTDRLGEHDAQQAPAWAQEALGPVPEDPVDRLAWTERAGTIHSYRERFGIESEQKIIGPEPSAHNPEMRAHWFDAFRAMNKAEGLDFTQLPEPTLRHMRDAYSTETGWAPPHVGKHLQQVRVEMERARLDAIRAEAEIGVAENDEARGRHEVLARSARTVEESFRVLEGQLAKAQEERDLYDKVSAGPRMVSVQADAELRRRNPKEKIEALRSAEPTVPDEPLTPGEEPEWVATLAEHSARFRDELERRDGQMIPDEDPDYEAVGEAYPVWRAQKEAILQPPKPEIRPAEKVTELAKERERE